MAHPHVELLTRLDEAFTGEDFDRVLEVFTDDATVHISGQSRMAGTYHGKAEFRKVMGLYLDALGDVQEMETHDIQANDRHGVQLQKVTARKADRTITINTVNVFHFAGEKVSEMWSVDFDQHEADAFYES